VKLCLLLVLVFCARALGLAQEVKQRWAVNLRDSHTFQSFDRGSHLTWAKQQGVVFLAPNRIAVYQVNEKLLPAPLGKRDVNGGGGNFLMDLKVLDAQDGHQINSIRLPTNAALSEVLPARSGRFIVRTGDMLYLFSPAFKVLATKSLPLDRVAPFESWELDIPPSSGEIVLVHQQLFIHEQVLADGTMISPGRAKADIEILDPDSLKLVKTFSLPNRLEHWSAADQFLVGAHSSRPFHAEEFGVLDFDGQWKELKVESAGRESCYAMMALDRQRVAAFGCNGLAVLSVSGDRIFSSKNRRHEVFASVAGSADYLGAISFAERGPLDSTSKPLHIDLFDLKSGAHLLGLPIEKNTVYYDVSSQGWLVVLEGETLKVFAPAN
jgi:hypothetical protein